MFIGGKHMDNIPIHIFSKLFGITSSKLRYWDDMGVFSPAGRHPETNYRYYSIAQLHALNFVYTLRALEIPLNIILNLKKERSPEIVLEILEKQERSLNLQIGYLNKQQSIIHARSELIRQGIKADETLIYILSREEKSIKIWPKNEYKDGDSYIKSLASKFKVAAEYHINLSFPIGGLFVNFDTFTKNPRLPCHFFSDDPFGLHKLKAGDYLTGFTRGCYDDINDLPHRLANYAGKNSLTLTGPVFIEYLFDELCTDDPKHFLARCSVAIEKKQQFSR
jgi:DNA-binding transcriptional MerR regulator